MISNRYSITLEVEIFRSGRIEKGENGPILVLLQHPGKRIGRRTDSSASAGENND